jgi:hypothetical protein
MGNTYFIYHKANPLFVVFQELYFGDGSWIHQMKLDSSNVTDGYRLFLTRPSMVYDYLITYFAVQNPFCISVHLAERSG